MWWEGRRLPSGCPVVNAGKVMCPTVVHLQVYMGCPVVQDTCRICHVSNCSMTTGNVQVCLECPIFSGHMRCKTMCTLQYCLSNICPAHVLCYNYRKCDIFLVLPVLCQTWMFHHFTTFASDLHL